MAKVTRVKQSSRRQGASRAALGVAVGAVAGSVAVAVDLRLAATLLIGLAVAAAFVVIYKSQTAATKQWSPRRAIAGPAFGALVVGVMSAAGVQYLAGTSASTNAWNTNTPQCSIDIKTGAIRPDVDPVYNKYGWFTPEGADKMKATLIVSGDQSCVKYVSFGSWRAPYGINGWLPVDSQTLFKGQTFELRPGTHDIIIPVPNCFYQIDLVYGKSPVAANGTPSYAPGQLFAAMWGGDKICVKNAPPKPVEVLPEPPPLPPVAPPTAPAPAPVVPLPLALPQTGPGNVVVIALIAIITGYLFAVLYNTQRAKTRRK